MRAYIWTVTRRMSCACLYLDCDKESELCVLTFGLVTSNDQVSGGRWGVGRSGFRSCTLCRPNFRADGSGRPRGRGPLTTLNTM